MSAYLKICELLPDDVPLAIKEQRVSTASALIRQAILTLECQGMPGPAVIAVAQHVLDTEAVARAAQEAR